MTTPQHAGNEEQRADERERDWDPLGGAPVVVDEVREMDVQRQEREVREDEGLDEPGSQTVGRAGLTSHGLTGRGSRSPVLLA